MNIPKVSVIIPVYNTEKYLKRCLDSLVTQTLPEIEIILVDDGSKEPCAALCDELAQTDDRVKVIHKANAGAGFARNTGLAVAKGEYIGFVDSDDYVAPQMYEKLYAAAQKYEADMVLSGVCYVGGNTFAQENAIETKEYFAKDMVFENEGIKDLLLGVVGALPHEPDDSRYGVGVWKSLFRRSVVEENGLQFMSEREIMSEDSLFLVDFIQHITRAVGIPGPYYCYCRNEDSYSKSYKKERFATSLVYLKEMEKHVASYVPEAEYRIYLNRLTQAYERVIASQEIIYARDQKLPYRVLRERLKMICTNPRVQAALKDYPWYRLPVKQAAFACAMKYKLYLLQKVMVLLRDR